MLRIGRGSGWTALGLSHHMSKDGVRGPPGSKPSKIMPDALPLRRLVRLRQGASGMTPAAEPMPLSPAPAWPRQSKEASSRFTAGACLVRCRRKAGRSLDASPGTGAGPLPAGRRFPWRSACLPGKGREGEGRLCRSWKPSPARILCLALIRFGTAVKIFGLAFSRLRLKEKGDNILKIN